MDKTEKYKKNLVEYYNDSYLKYGANSEGASWGDEEKHLKRLNEIIRLIGKEELKSNSLLDVGCGYGALISQLKKIDGYNVDNYTGVDPSQAAIRYAIEEHGDSRFYVKDIKQASTLGNHRIIISCGVFTKKAECDDSIMKELISNFLGLAHQCKAKIICFNTMSPFCDFQGKDLYYPSMNDVVEVINEHYGYRVENLSITNTHLKYELIWKFSIK